LTPYLCRKTRELTYTRLNKAAQELYFKGLLKEDTLQYYKVCVEHHGEWDTKHWPHLYWANRCFVAFPEPNPS
jgi:hypothetical protein